MNDNKGQNEQNELRDLDLPEEESADVKGGLRVKAIERDPSTAGQYISEATPQPKPKSP